MEWHQSLLFDKDGPKTMKEAANLLFSIMSVGDDRNIDETWIMGERAYQKSATKELATAGKH